MAPLKLTLKLLTNYSRNPTCLGFPPSVFTKHNVDEQKRENEKQSDSRRLMAVCCFVISQRSIQSIVICVSVSPPTHTRHECDDALIREWKINRITQPHCDFPMTHLGVWQLMADWQHHFPLRRMASEITLFNTPLFCFDSDKYHICDWCYNYCFYWIKQINILWNLGCNR